MPSQDSPERFSIDELSTLAGVTPRTVRYYIAEGLVDRPEGEKRGSHCERLAVPGDVTVSRLRRAR